MKQILIIAAVIIAVLLLGTFILARVVFPGNTSETSANHEDGKLKTRIYDVNLQSVFETVKQIIPTLSTYGSNWKLINEKMENNAAAIDAEVPVIVFTDDLKISLKQSGEKTSVDVYSSSRVGRSDFGENRRHNLQILNALDQKFAPRK
jgi:uncharacterized protein (DUF1499 family)